MKSYPNVPLDDLSRFSLVSNFYSPRVREPVSHYASPSVRRIQTSPSIPANVLQRHCSTWDIGTQTVRKCCSKSSTFTRFKINKSCRHRGLNPRRTFCAIIFQLLFQPYYLRVCVCVFFPSILDINGRTSRGHTGGRSHRIFNPPSFCGACLDFCREKDSAIPFPRRP